MFFLDDYHVRLGNSLAARKHLIDFVQTQLGPKDLVSVMYPLSPLDSVVLTRNHDQLVHAIERFQGRKFDYTPRNALEDRYANQPTEIVERVRRQVSLSALTGLSVKLGALREGRKAIVLVSEGYVAMLPPQLRGAGRDDARPRQSQPQQSAGRRQQPAWRIGPASCAELDVQSELQRVFEEANRSNTAIYAVDPRGLSTGEFDIQDNVGRPDQPGRPAPDAEHAAGAGRRDRRPRHHQPQRPGRRHEADRARLERLLPARLQLDAVAQRRQVPPDQGAGAPPRRAGAGAQGLLGADGRRDRAGDGAAQARAAAGDRPLAGRHRRQRPTAAWSARGSARHRPTAARRG